MEESKQVKVEISKATTAEEGESKMTEKNSKTRFAKITEVPDPDYIPVSTLRVSATDSYSLAERDKAEVTEVLKPDYIHFRARRGPPTDSYSLAERVRREKINERMKILQALVPGCDRVSGKAVMLDEIINYVKSLQRLVEVETKAKPKTHNNLCLENAESSYTSETAEWTLLITSLLVEGISAVLDQLGDALIGMVMAFLALFLSIVDLARKERIARSGRSLLPCFYRHNFPNCKPFGSLVEYYGLIGAVWQSSYSTIEYYYTRQNLDNPIKMCL